MTATRDCRAAAPAPMLATLGAAPGGARWAIEHKWDGQRGLAVVDGEVRLFSRNGMDITRTFPEVSAALSGVGRRMVLDGELVALDDRGRPCFQRLQRRWPQSRRPAPQLLAEVPVRFFVFDVLHVDGADVSAWRYADRRALLEQLQFNRPNVLAVPPMWTGVDPQTMLDVCREHALEGIVSKRLDSAYRAGRSPDWVKTPLRRSAEVVVVGWVPGAGPNSASVGSLLVASHTPDGQAVLVGQVGTGLTSRHRATLSAVLRRIERKTPPVSARLCPIVGTPRWVTPKYVGTVEYREFGDGGLRHSSWKGLRELAAELVSLPERA